MNPLERRLEKIEQQVGTGENARASYFVVAGDHSDEEIAAFIESEGYELHEDDFICAVVPAPDKSGKRAHFPLEWVGSIPPAEGEHSNG